MPELPEVEVTRQGIAPSITGRRITATEFRCQALRYPLPFEAQQSFVGQVVHAVERRGKYLILRCDYGYFLLHLGMSGSLRLVAPTQALEKHDHVDFCFASVSARANGKADDRADIVLRLRDPRRFGAVLWIAGGEEALMAHPLMTVLGIEPLSELFTPEWLKAALAGIKAPIKPALMDSHRVVGIGNIYASESLFRAGIDPRTPAGSISLARLKRLVPEIQATLTRAIAVGGSSLRDFIHSDGSSGYFQQEYFVYGRTGELCRRCATAIRELRQSNRASFYCPKCQR